MTALPNLDRRLSRHRATLLTPEEAAERLHISTRTLRDLKSRGLIRYVAVTARRIAYRPDDCDEYLASVIIEPKPVARELMPWATFPRTPCVYFVRAGPRGPVKIGCAKRLKARLHALRTAHHEELILLATMAGGVEQERQLHQHFGEHRLRGEWFKPDESLLAFIETIRGTAG